MRPGDPLPAGWSPVLRRVILGQLAEDLQRRGIRASTLDFAAARPLGPAFRALDGEVTPMAGVQVRDEADRLVFEGDVAVLWDPMAEVLEVFFGPDLPESVWDRLDAGVRRRLLGHPSWSIDPRVRAWGVRRAGG